MFKTIYGSLRLLSQRQKLGLGLFTFLTVVLNGLDLLAIVILGAIASIAVGGINFLSSWFGDTSRDEMLVLLMVVVALMFIIKTTGGLFIAKARQQFLARLEVRFSRIVAEHIFTMNLTDMKKQSRAEMEWALVRSTAIAFGGVLGRALELVSEFTLGVSIVVLFFIVDSFTALIVVSYFGAVILIFQLLSRNRQTKTGQNFAGGTISTGQAIGDAITAFKEIAVLSKFDFFLDRISSARARVAAASATQSYMQAVPRLVIELALIVGTLGFVTLEFVTSGGNPDFTVITIFIFGSLRIMSALLPLQRAALQLRFDGPQAIVSQQFVREATDKQTEQKEFRGIPELLASDVAAPRPTSVGIELTVSGVAFTYSDGASTQMVLQDISMEVPPGSTVAIIGPSGAGKSTLVDLILGLHSPLEGEVVCSGLSPQLLRTRHPGVVGYVPQTPGLVSGTIRDNVALGIHPADVDEKNLWAALKAAELDQFVMGLENGVDSQIGKQVDSLSGGQIQRIGLARALYGKPRLLVLDEATSALDAETEASISASLKRLGSATTVVIVAHRLSTIRNADNVFLLDKGKIQASGTLEQLLRKSSQVRNFVRLMSISAD